MTEAEIILRIAVAGVLSSAIGYEREFSRKPAGLRTHALVGVGAAIFTIASIIGFDGPDESRVAAQIVTGVGFLGAGAIFRDRAGVGGLTTAAGLWTAAAIGMASGSGQWVLATAGTAVVLLILLGMHAIDLRVARRVSEVPAHVEVVLESADRVSSVVKFTGKMDSSIRELDLKRSPEGEATLTLEVPADQASITAELLASLKGIKSARVVPPLEMRRFDT